MRTQLKLLPVLFLLIVSCSGKNKPNLEKKENTGSGVKESEIFQIDPQAEKIKREAVQTIKAEIALAESQTLNNPIDVIKINNINKTKDISLSEVGIVDIDYIPLETNNKCLISNIQELKGDGKSFFIYDFRGIYKFSVDGKFVTNLGRKGKGPQEYLNAHDFSINKITQNVYILSAMQDKIFVYSSIGQFIKTINCQANTTDIYCNDDDILCYSRNMTGDVENSFDIIDYKGKLIKSFPNKYKYKVGRIQSGFTNECFFFNSKNQLHLKELHSDTVFVLRGKEFVPQYILYRGDKRFPPEMRILNKEGDEKKEKPFMIGYTMFEFGDFIYYDYRYNVYNYQAVIDRTKNQIYNSYRSGFINDIDGGPRVFFNTTFDGNQAVSWINPIELKKYVSSIAFKNSTPKYPEKKKALEKLANSLSDNDNPVLMLVKLKE